MGILKRPLPETGGQVMSDIKTKISQPRVSETRMQILRAKLETILENQGRNWCQKPGGSHQDKIKQTKYARNRDGRRLKK